MNPLSLDARGSKFNSHLSRQWFILTVFAALTYSIGEAQSSERPPQRLIAEGGKIQTGAPGGFAPEPLVVAIKGGARNAVAHQSIRFAVHDGGQVQASSSTAPTTTVDVSTDDRGRAQVFFRLPDAPNESFVVTATSASDNHEQMASFVISSDDGTHPHPSPFEATIQATLNADDSSTITWTNRVDGATGFRILRSDNKGKTWRLAGTSPVDSRSFTIPAGYRLGMIGYSVFKVEPIVTGQEAQLIAANTPASEDDPGAARERKMKAAEDWRKERNKATRSAMPSN